MNQSEKDNIYMQRCLYLASLAGVNVSPNPMVGAVIVYEDEIIGEGYHQFFGGPHAEVNAVNSSTSTALIQVIKINLFATENKYNVN